MAAKSIETKLSIVGEDKTGSTFGDVARKLRTIEQAAAGVSKRMDAVSAGMSNFAQKARHEDIARRMGYGVAATVAAASPRVASASARMSGSIASNAAEFASYAAPGVAGAALGMSGAAIGGMAAGGVAYYGLKSAVSFEKSMAEVKKKVTLPEGHQWSEVEDMIDRAALAVGKTREQIAELTAAGGQAGVVFKDLAEFVMLTAKASGSWDVSTRDAAMNLAQIKVQTGWSMKQLADYADKINALGDTTPAAERDVLEMMKRSGAAAKASGLPLDTTAAITTALNSTGMQPEIAARFTSAMAGTLRTATTGGKKTNAAWAQIGLTPKAVEDGMVKDATGTIMNVLDRIEKSKDKAKISQAIFGKEWWDEAARAGETVPEIRKNLSLLKGDSWKGGLDKNQQNDLNTTANHVERFGVLTAKIGDHLSRWSLPTINNVLEGVLSAASTGKGPLAGPWGMPGADEKAPSGLLETAADRFDKWWNRKPKVSGVADMTIPTTGAFMPMTGAFDHAAYGNDWDGTGRASPKWKAGSSAYASTPAMPTGVRSGLTGFGLSGPAAPPIAKLEGAAKIENVIRVEPAEWFRVKVEQLINAYGNLRADNGVSMEPWK